MKERFKRVIAEWLSGGPPEALDREVELPLAPNEVVTVTGARRAGKTYLLFSTIRKILDRGLASQDEILYVDFEDSRLRGARAEDLDGMVEAFVELAGRRPRYLFLDEVQRVGGYGGWLRRRLNAHVYLSGSTSELTPRRVADEMRGRSVSYEVYPLSFREFLRFKGVRLGRYFGHTEERGKVLSLLREYLQYGAYPAVALSGDRERLLRSYFDSVVVRDLSVVKPEVAEYFADSLICGYSSLISINKIYGDLRSSFRVGKETVSSLFDRAEETYFAFLVEIFDKSLRRRRMNPKKLYVIDTGYVHVRGCEYSISKAMENAVFLELKRRGVGDIYYWKEYGKRDGREVEVGADEVKVGDMLLVRAGETIAADGVVDDGKGEVEESVLTGEPMPVLKSKGSPVVGGSRLVSGFLKVYVTRSGERTYVAQLMTAVRDAEAARLRVQDLVDRVAAAFTPTIIAVAAVTFLAWHFALGAPTARALLFAVAVLASACPCALGLATPMAVLVSVHRLARRGVVVKDGEALERVRDVDVFVIDKTGTLTEGRPRVVSFTELEPGAMDLASSVEALSSHPVARAIAERFGGGLSGQVREFNEFPGDGVSGVVGDRQVIVGRPEFIAQNCEGEARGDVAVCVDGRVAGLLTLEDPVRPEAKELVGYLKGIGRRVIIATGDSGPSADLVASGLGVELVKGLTPDGKAELVRKLRGEGHRVAFIGDGVNDAVAEREADVGIALAGGTDIAKYAGDVIVGSLRGVEDLLRESRVAVRKVKENLAWAFGYNSVLVPLAAGMLYPAVYISPPYAALAMSMSSVIVFLWSMVPA